MIVVLTLDRTFLQSPIIPDARQISRQLRVLSFDLRPQTLRLSPEQQPFGRLLSLLASLGFITGLGPCFAVCCFHRSAASDTAAFTEAATFRSTALVFRIASVHRRSVRFPSFLVLCPALGAQPVSSTQPRRQNLDLPGRKGLPSWSSVAR
jgi:hypothetical protein